MTVYLLVVGLVLLPPTPTDAAVGLSIASDGSPYRGRETGKGNIVCCLIGDLGFEKREPLVWKFNPQFQKQNNQNKYRERLFPPLSIYFFSLFLRQGASCTDQLAVMNDDEYVNSNTQL